MGDLQERLRDIAAGRWTPELVIMRLVEGFDVLNRTPTKIGPKSPGGSWPHFVHLVEEDDAFKALAAIAPEMADRLMQEEIDDIIASKVEEHRNEADRQIKVPSPAETSRADEALGWCLTYLRDEPMQADAVQLYARCRAKHSSAAAILRGRCIKADEIIEDRNAEIRADEARDKMIARELYRRRSQVMTGRVFTKRYFDLMRKRGAQTLAKALNKEGVEVR